MKLMGTGVLVKLMAGAGAETLGAVRAFHAELVAADWRSPADFLAAYPDCDCDNDQALVALGDRSVALRFDFASGCVLLERVGLTVGLRRALEAHRS